MIKNQGQIIIMAAVSHQHCAKKIIYNGKNNVYTTNVKGIHLLIKIELKKFNEKLTLDDILLYTEQTAEHVKRQV